MEAHVSRALIDTGTSDGVVEGVGNEKVASSNQQPERQPTILGKGELMAVGAGEFIAVAAGTEMNHSGTSALAHGGVGSLQSARLTRFHITKHQILAGQVEVAQHAHIVGGAWVPGQLHTVLAAPGGNRLIVGLFEPGFDGPRVVGTVPFSLRFPLIPEGRQMGSKVVLQEPIDMSEGIACTRAGSPSCWTIVFTQRAGFIGKDRPNGSAEVLGEFIVIALIDFIDKAGHGVRVEQVGCRRMAFINLPLILAAGRIRLDEMKPTNGSVNGLIHDRQVMPVMAAFDLGDECLRRV